MTPLETFTIVTAGAGVLFIVAGTIGLLRFPDVHSRLHSLTKADNLGLGLIAISLMPHGSFWSVLKLVAVWLLAMLAAATVSQLIGRAALTEGMPSQSAERQE